MGETATHDQVVEANRRYHDSCISEYERPGGDTHVGYHHYRRRVDEHLDTIEKHLSKPPEECLALDCGAGSGFLTGMLLQRGYRVAAVEVSSAMREVLNERYGKDSRLEI